MASEQLDLTHSLACLRAGVEVEKRQIVAKAERNGTSPDQTIEDLERVERLIAAGLFRIKNADLISRPA